MGYVVVLLVFFKDKTDILELGEGLFERRKGKVRFLSG